MTLDASPFGLGGILTLDGRVIAWFASALTKLDSKRFGCPLGDSSGQQEWEAVCILVALTAWRSHWMKRNVALTLKSDNLSALTVASQLKDRRNRTLIAKELSLLYSDRSYEPSFYTHIPGSTNVLSDSLSRLGSG